MRRGRARRRRAALGGFVLHISQATLAGRRAAREAGDHSWLAYTVYAHPDARLEGRPQPLPAGQVVHAPTPRA